MIAAPEIDGGREAELRAIGVDAEVVHVAYDRVSITLAVSDFEWIMEELTDDGAAFDADTKERYYDSGHDDGHDEGYTDGYAAAVADIKKLAVES